MFNEAFSNHGDAHGPTPHPKDGPKDWKPIMVALRSVSTHGTSHPADDYFPLETTWKAVPFRSRLYQNGSNSQKINVEGYMAERQANRPPQSSMPTIKYAPAHQQARTDVRSKEARHVKKKIASKKNNKGVNGVKTTFGKKNLEFVSVKQLEQKLLKELKCTVLPLAEEMAKKKTHSARKNQAGKIRRDINIAVSKVISALDPYALANMASRELSKDRNVNARIKTGLRHIVRQLHARKKPGQKRKRDNPPEEPICYGCQNLHYTHTCNRKRRVAHCCMAIQTKRPIVEDTTEESARGDITDNENPNSETHDPQDPLVTPDQVPSNAPANNQERSEEQPPNIREDTPPLTPPPNIRIKDEQTNTANTQASVIERLQNTVRKQDRQLEEVLAALQLAQENATRQANAGYEEKPSQDRRRKERNRHRTPGTPSFDSLRQVPLTPHNRDNTHPPDNEDTNRYFKRENSDGYSSPSDPSNSSSNSSSGSSSSEDDMVILLI